MQVVLINDMKQNIEIERKFLVKDDSYKSMAIRHYDICQGYIAKGNGRTVRIRIRDNEAFITIKTAPQPNSIAHFEWERPISMDDARELMAHCLPGMIEKCRYIVPCTKDDVQCTKELVWEVDEFHGRLEGLVLAEIELEDENQTFDKPAFIGEEVTGQPQYYNANM